jgi:hypothetical protein
MSVKVAKNRFIHSSLEVWAALYQQLIPISDSHRLGRWLVAECEKAQMLRQTEFLKESSLILSGIPIQEYQLIGQFYQGFACMSQNPRKVFEEVIEKSITYKSKALIALAALELKDNNCELGIKYCSEAIRRSHNISTKIHAARSITVIKSAEGFHALALKDLEALAPLTRYASPIARYQYLNSLAVELGEVGRVEEAKNVCKIVLASPFAFAYPEWHETGREIALKAYKSRSAVSVIQPISENIIPLPVSESSSPVETKPARVLSYLDWKKKMGQEDYDSMTETDLVFKIFRLASEQSDNWLRLRKIVDYILKVSSEPC